MALLRVGELHVQLLEARLGGHAALLQRLQRGIHLGQIAGELLAAGAGLLGQLGQAQGFDLQLVRARLAFGCLAPCRHQALGRIGIPGLGLDERVARLLADQRLRTQLLFEVLDLLRARQQAGLLGIGRVEAHAVRADAVAAFYIDGLARLQLATLGQRVFQRGRGVAAGQPVGQQGLLRRIVQAQQVGQRGQRAALLGRRGLGRAVEGQPGGRRILREGAHHVEPADFQRRHALAQRCFQRRLPAGFHVQAAPQALQAVQAVFGQPGLQLAVGLDLVLQCLQGFHPRSQVGLAGGFLVDGLLGDAARLVQQGRLLLQLVQAGVGLFGDLLCLGQLALQIEQALLVGRGQGVLVGGQALAAGVELAGLVLDAALLGGQHLDLLLHLADGAALLGRLRVGLAQRVFQRGENALLLFQLRGQGDGAVLALGGLGGDLLQLGLGILPAGGPLGGLLGQLGQAGLGALAAFDHEADLGLQPADLGAGLVQAPLRLVDLVAGGVVRLADGFQISLDVAQVGHAGLQLGLGLLGVGLQAHLAFLGLGALHEPELVLLERGALLQAGVLLGHLGLLFQPVEVVVQLAQDVFHAGEVLARVGQAVLGLAAALLVLGDAGGLFQEQAQLFRARLDDAADGALADDGVGARAEARAQEHVLHVAPAHRLVVDVVAAGTVAREHALDGDFGELAPLAAGAVVAVVEHQLHAGAAGRLAAGGAVEDHVLHGLATQLAGLGFAQHPAHGVHDVGLAAAVGADHADQLARQLEIGGLGERLEAGKFDGIETHETRAAGAVQGQGRGETAIIACAMGRPALRAGLERTLAARIWRTFLPLRPSALKILLI